MSRPPNEDDGDAGSARARTAAPGDRARATRGAIGVETAARAAVAMAAFKPAWTGRRGARRQSRRKFPEKIRPRVKFRRLPTVWPRGWIGVSTFEARIDARHGDATVRGESSARPAGRAAGIQPSTRLERASNRVGKEPLAGRRKRASRPTAGPDHARLVGSSGARRATIRERSLTSRVPANVPRAFRATRVGVPRVPRVMSRLDGFNGAISGRRNDIFARVMSCHRWRAWRFGSIS